MRSSRAVTRRDLHGEGHLLGERRSGVDRSNSSQETTTSPSRSRRRCRDRSGYLGRPTGARRLHPGGHYRGDSTSLAVGTGARSAAAVRGGTRRPEWTRAARRRARDHLAAALRDGVGGRARCRSASTGPGDDAPRQLGNLDPFEVAAELPSARRWPARSQRRSRRTPGRRAGGRRRSRPGRAG
jgi:hypothetical protein